MVNLFNREWSKVELLRRVGHMGQLAGIRLMESGDGKARGFYNVREGLGHGRPTHSRLEICHSR